MRDSNPLILLPPSSPGPGRSARGRNLGQLSAQQALDRSPTGIGPSRIGDHQASRLSKRLHVAGFQDDDSRVRASQGITKSFRVASLERAAEDLPVLDAKQIGAGFPPQRRSLFMFLDEIADFQFEGRLKRDALHRDHRSIALEPGVHLGFGPGPHLMIMVRSAMAMIASEKRFAAIDPKLCRVAIRLLGQARLSLSFRSSIFIDQAFLLFLEWQGDGSDQQAREMAGVNGNRSPIGGHWWLAACPTPIGPAPGIGAQIEQDRAKRVPRDGVESLQCCNRRQLQHGVADLGPAGPRYHWI